MAGRVPDAEPARILADQTQKITVAHHETLQLCEYSWANGLPWWKLQILNLSNATGSIIGPTLSMGWPCS